MRLHPFFRYTFTVLTLGAVFFVGYLFGHQNLKFESTLVPKIVNTELAKPREIDFSLFWDTWNLLRDKFIGELDARKLIFGAIRGMVAAVDDPYTVFLPPDESESFLDDLAGKFDGIGAEIAIRNDRLVIVSPLEGSPAEQAGLRPKDWVLSVDGESTDAMSLNEATNRIRGKAGTVVTLLILSEDSQEPREVKVTRATITVESVQVSYQTTPAGKKIANIKIVQFGPNTPDRMKRAADEVRAARAAGIIIDLRNNPGGYLDAAIDITSLFVKEDVILKERKKDGGEEVLNRTLSAKLTDLPLMVLVNGGSASASEIMAGAIQDYGRGKIIGEQTFGKGSVQDLENLKGGSSLRVTVAKWLTPKGREIDKDGIKPDIEVERTEEDIDADRDPQLDRALAELDK